MSCYGTITLVESQRHNIASYFHGLIIGKKINLIRHSFVFSYLYVVAVGKHKFRFFAVEHDEYRFRISVI